MLKVREAPNKDYLFDKGDSFICLAITISEKRKESKEIECENNEDDETYSCNEVDLYSKLCV